MSAPKKFYTVTWDQFHRDARALAWKLVGKGPWRGIIAITRGGLIPAAIIARELDIRLVDSVCIVTYRNEYEVGEPRILKRPDVGDGEGEGFLVIDDLVDSGTTGRVVRSLLPKAHFATVYAKPKGMPLVDAFVTEVSQDTWILFPWDSEPQPVQPIVEIHNGR